MAASRQAWHWRSRGFYISFGSQLGKDWLFCTGQGFETHTHSDALPPTRPHLQTVPPPGPSVIMITVIIELRFY